jgi:hypothetical protein
MMKKRKHSHPLPLIDNCIAQELEDSPRYRLRHVQHPLNDCIINGGVSYVAGGYYLRITTVLDNIFKFPEIIIR